MNETIGDRDVAALLAAASPGQEVFERLHRRFVDTVTSDGILDVAYTTIDTPVGSLLLAATKKGLVRVAFASEDHDKVLGVIATKLSPRILRAPQRLDEAAREIEQYFAGSRKVFDLRLDLSLSSGFRRQVQRHLPDIAYGSTESYTEVARLVGSPKAVRAVGSACATNPIPLVVPCHRVLRSDGTLGGYVGGLAVKAALLKLEGRRDHLNDAPTNDEELS